MKSIYLEKIAPYALAVSCTVLWFSLDLRLPTGDGVLGSSLTLGAILTGFLSTAKAIIMSLDSPIMIRIRGTSYLNDVVSYLGQAIWLSFSFCIISIVGYFVSTNSTWFGLLWIFFGISSAGAFIRVTNIMLKIIKHNPS